VYVQSTASSDIDFDSEANWLNRKVCVLQDASYN